MLWPYTNASNGMNAVGLFVMTPPGGGEKKIPIVEVASRAAGRRRTNIAIHVAFMTTPFIGTPEAEHVTTSYAATLMQRVEPNTSDLPLPPPHSHP
jgi:hypothetical protein